MSLHYSVSCYVAWWVIVLRSPPFSSLAHPVTDDASCSRSIPTLSPDDSKRVNRCQHYSYILVFVIHYLICTSPIFVYASNYMNLAPDWVSAFFLYNTTSIFNSNSYLKYWNIRTASVFMWSICLLLYGCIIYQETEESHKKSVGWPLSSSEIETGPPRLRIKSVMKFTYFKHSKKC
jgi:hypothetical protein